jgi:hypothetical protein
MCILQHAPSRPQTQPGGFFIQKGNGRKMDYITEPSIQEMFFYFLVLSGIITLFLTVIFSPLILGEIIRALRGK